MSENTEIRMKNYGIAFFYTYLGFVIWTLLDALKLVGFPHNLAMKAIDVGLGLFIITFCYEVSRGIITIIAYILTKISIYYTKTEET